MWANSTTGLSLPAFLATRCVLVATFWLVGCDGKPCQPRPGVALVSTGCALPCPYPSARDTVGLPQSPGPEADGAHLCTLAVLPALPLTVPRTSSTLLVWGTLEPEPVPCPFIQQVVTIFVTGMALGLGGNDSDQTQTWLFRILIGGSYIILHV